MRRPLGVRFLKRAGCLFALLSACSPTPAEWGAAADYVPPSSRLASGVANKYYEHYHPGKGKDASTNIAYYGLGEYEQAYKYLSRYIDEVTRDEGEEWVDSYAFLYRGLTQEKRGKLDAALSDFDTVRRYDENLSDAYYHQSRIQLQRGNVDTAARLLEQARQRFNRGYFHQRPYVEVLEQLYAPDLDQLAQRIQRQSDF